MATKIKAPASKHLDQSIKANDIPKNSQAQTASLSLTKIHELTQPFS